MDYERILIAHSALPSVTSLRCRGEMVGERDSTTEGTRHTSPPAIYSPGIVWTAVTMSEMTTVYRETVDRIPLNFKKRGDFCRLLKRLKKKRKA